MSRIPFSQALKNAKVDPRREYDRLYSLFCLKKLSDAPGGNITIKDCCAFDFLKFPLRGTCISLEDFDKSHGYNFTKSLTDCDFDHLVSFCEYSYNLAVYNQHSYYITRTVGSCDPIQLYMKQVLTVVEKVGYMPNVQNGVTDFVPKDQVAISVAEIIDPSLSYRVIEYNHHLMKGDLDRKKATLHALVNKLEPRRKELEDIDSNLETDLFFLFNNVNLRHNNVDPIGKNYAPIVSAMDNDELEKWYDDAYQMCLLAFLELDHIERKNRVKQLKEVIKKQKR